MFNNRGTNYAKNEVETVVQRLREVGSFFKKILHQNVRQILKDGILVVDSEWRFVALHVDLVESRHRQQTTATRQEHHVAFVPLRKHNVGNDVDVFRYDGVPAHRCHPKQLRGGSGVLVRHLFPLGVVLPTLVDYAVVQNTLRGPLRDDILKIIQTVVVQVFQQSKQSIQNRRGVLPKTPYLIGLAGFQSNCKILTPCSECPLSNKYS
jgi:hypothetical protein